MLIDTGEPPDQGEERKRVRTELVSEIRFDWRIIMQHDGGIRLECWQGKPRSCPAGAIPEFADAIPL